MNNQEAGHHYRPAYKAMTKDLMKENWELRRQLQFYAINAPELAELLRRLKESGQAIPTEPLATTHRRTGREP